MRPNMWRVSNCFWEAAPCLADNTKPAMPRTHDMHAGGGTDNSLQHQDKSVTVGVHSPAPAGLDEMAVQFGQPRCKLTMLSMNPTSISYLYLQGLMIPVAWGLESARQAQPSSQDLRLTGLHMMPDMFAMSSLILDARDQA